MRTCEKFESDLINVYAANKPVFLAEVKSAEKASLVSCILLAVSIILYVSWHLGSLFLGLACMFQVLVSVPVSLFIYEQLMGIEYISILHLFVIIMIIGIGADDIFVFHDFWEHTRHIGVLRYRVPLRLAYTLRKAAKAMLTTSATTAVSFLSTCINPVMPIVSFGIFAFVVVTINYVMLILVVPALYVYHELEIRPSYLWMKDLQCCCRSKKVPVPATEGGDEEEELKKYLFKKNLTSMLDMTPLNL